MQEFVSTSSFGLDLFIDIHRYSSTCKSTTNKKNISNKKSKVFFYQDVFPEVRGSDFSNRNSSLYWGMPPWELLVSSCCWIHQEASQSHPKRAVISWPLIQTKEIQGHRQVGWCEWLVGWLDLFFFNWHFLIDCFFLWKIASSFWNLFFKIPSPEWFEHSLSWLFWGLLAEES